MSNAKTSQNYSCEPTAKETWHKLAPSPVRKAYLAGKPLDGWQAWGKHLAKRKQPLALKKLFGNDDGGLSWALPVGVKQVSCPACCQGDETSVENDILTWISEAAGAEGNLQGGLVRGKSSPFLSPSPMSFKP